MLCPKPEVHQCPVSFHDGARPWLSKLVRDPGRSALQGFVRQRRLVEIRVERRMGEQPRRRQFPDAGDAGEVVAGVAAERTEVYKAVAWEPDGVAAFLPWKRDRIECPVVDHQLLLGRIDGHAFVHQLQEIAVARRDADRGRRALDRERRDEVVRLRIVAAQDRHRHARRCLDEGIDGGQDVGLVLAEARLSFTARLVRGVDLSPPQRPALVECHDQPLDPLGHALSRRRSGHRWSPAANDEPEEGLGQPQEGGAGLALWRIRAHRPAQRVEPGPGNVVPIGHQDHALQHTALPRVRDLLLAPPLNRYDDVVAHSPLRIAVLGSTGSIGRQSLDVISRYPERFRVQALAAGTNCGLLEQQVAAFAPRYVSSTAESPGLRDAIAARGARPIPLDDIATVDDIDLLLVGTAGAAGLLPTIRALQRGLPVAIANKEVLVMAGHLIRQAMLDGGGELRPVDSEHSAIWQCLWGESDHEIRRIILTASGGAFRDLDPGALDAVTPAQALDHPTWNMGQKITVDSATLMNKGMETIEAMWLFGVPMHAVEVVVHRQSIVHSLVEFADGSVKAQLGYPDMRLPIECALSYPDRMPKPTAAPLDLAAVGSLTFERPDVARFPCLGLAMEAGRAGGTLPAVMAAADEIAVQRFLTNEVRFTAIPRIVEAVMQRHTSSPDPSLEAVIDADAWARRLAAEVTP